MGADTIAAALRSDAVWIVFVNALLQQLGLPVPAVPTLLVAGSLAMSYGQAGQLLAAAVFASLLADLLWYAVGRAFGYRVLASLCRLSLNPGSCVSSAELLFMRWGVWSLIVAKFVPGFSTVGPPIAGSLKFGVPTFVAASALGAGLWAGAAILGGWVLRSQVQWAIDALGRHGATALSVLGVAAGVWLAWLLWRKRRFARLADIPHISPAALAEMMASATPPLLLDLRGPAQIASSGPLAGATPAQLDTLSRAAADWPKQRQIVTLCACPNDATAVQAARQLMELGFGSVQPLSGGYESWVQHLGGRAS